MRQDCLKRAARRVPGFYSLSSMDQLKRIEQLTGLSLPLLEQALNRPVEHQAQTITDIIAALQHLRNQL
jgi:mannose/fructose-specific phosphotransferase system component IIA